jgi:hypothetical protein
MKHEESFRLMELMIQMGFSSETIMGTLIYCAMGMSIGPAFMEATKDGWTCKTDTRNQEPDPVICE